MWKFIVDVVHDFVSSLQPDVGRVFLHVSNVFLLYVANNLSSEIDENMNPLDKVYIYMDIVPYSLVLLKPQSLRRLDSSSLEMLKQ